MLQPLLCDLMPKLSKAIKEWDQLVLLQGEGTATSVRLSPAVVRAKLLTSLTDRLASCYNCLLTPGLEASSSSSSAGLASEGE